MRNDRHLKIILAALGLFNVATGLSLLFAPRWFFEVAANFAPFNRHLLGDAGAFVLALGVGLLWAARDPVRQFGLIAVAALASSLHALNHVFDDLLSRFATGQWLTGTLPLAVMAALLVYVAVRVREKEGQGRAQ